MKKIIIFLFNEFTNDIRVYKESNSLRNAGFKVHIVAILAKGLKKKDTFNNISIERLKVNYINIFSINLIVFWIKAILKYRRNSVFHCNDLYTLPIGVGIKILFNKNAKIVYDCHEHETEAYIYEKKPFIKNIAKFIERHLIKHADHIITVSNSIALDYKKNYFIKKPSLVLNCPKYSKYKKSDILRRKFNIPKNTKIILYQGEYRKGQGLKTIINTFNKIKDNNIVLVFLGYGPQKNLIADSLNKSNNIFIHKTVSINRFMNIISSADYGIHLMENNCINHDYALPNKFFEYIMAGLPVIVSNLCEMKKIVEKYKIGFVVKKNTSKELLKVINRLKASDYNRMKTNLEKAAKIYSWENQEKTLINIYENL